MSHRIFQIQKLEIKIVQTVYAEEIIYRVNITGKKKKK